MQKIKKFLLYLFRHNKVELLASLVLIFTLQEAVLNFIMQNGILKKVALMSILICCAIVIYRSYRINHQFIKFKDALAKNNFIEINKNTQNYNKIFQEINAHFTEIKNKNEENEYELKKYKFLNDNATDLITIADSKGKVTYCSLAVEKLLGYSFEQWMGMHTLERLHPDDVSTWKQQLKESKNTENICILQGRFKHLDGRYIHVESSIKQFFDSNGNHTEALSISRDITERVKMKESLEKTAKQDNLTGLLNRGAFIAHLDSFCNPTQKNSFALCMLDLDRFKQVNDSFGHETGDEYLKEVANRIKSVLRPDDILGRMGGDEFVLIFPKVEKAEDIYAISHRIIEEVSKPFSCKGVMIDPKVSIGMTLCHKNNEIHYEGSELLLQADRALYKVKSNGGNGAILYSTVIADSMKKDFDIEQKITQAIKNNSLAIQYQPIVNAKSKRPALAEALVRIRNNDGSLIGPGYFIEIAEKTGLIVQIGEWVLSQACLYSRKLEQSGTFTSISVNVSPKQLQHLNYLESVKKIVKQTQVNTNNIILELTESALITDSKKTQYILNELKKMGFKLALDDFGTGYSSISMLKDLPFDILKIDRSFVSQMQTDKLGVGTLSSIIDMGKHFNMTIIAEGIETIEQSDALEHLGCDLFQGFLFHKPIDSQIHETLFQNDSEPIAWHRFSLENDCVLF